MHTHTPGHTHTIRQRQTHTHTLKHEISSRILQEYWRFCRLTWVDKHLVKSRKVLRYSVNKKKKVYIRHPVKLQSNLNHGRELIQYSSSLKSLIIVDETRDDSRENINNIALRHIWIWVKSKGDPTLASMALCIMARQEGGEWGVQWSWKEALANDEGKEDIWLLQRTTDEGLEEPQSKWSLTNETHQER